MNCPTLLGVLWLVTAGAAWAGSSPDNQARAETQAAQSVVTLSPAMAKLVCAAGGCDHLVGVAAYTQTPPQAARVRTISNGYSIDYEALALVQPDLVLALEPYTTAKTIDRLRRLGLRVEALKVDRLADIAPALRRLGTWLGTADVADHAAENFAQRLQALQARYRTATPVKVLIQFGLHPVWTVNRDNILSEAAGVCGGENVFASLPRIAEPVGMEALLMAHPDVVVYGNYQSAAQMQAFWSHMADTPVVQNDALIAVDIGVIGEAAPPILDGIAHLCMALDRVRRQRDR